MYAMFMGATAFSSDISKWDVSSVCDMYGMFMDAKAFNIDISNWDVSRVVNMDYMFWNWKGASFNRNLCGPAWVQSKASKKAMFVGSYGSISSQFCTPIKHQHVSRRPISERELIARAPITTPVDGESTCLKCGTFKISGRASCCAPGGAWHQNCGGAGNKNAEHRWFEGIEACKRKCKAGPM